MFAGACLGVPELPRSGGNFTEYKLRFHSTSLYAGANSGSGNNRYYSFNQGLTHFIVFSAEAYLYARDEGFLASQLAFMNADLKAVDRTATPWVVALVHKDMSMEPEAYAAFSPILAANKVDILFVGHVHCACEVFVFARKPRARRPRAHVQSPPPPHPPSLP